MPAHRDELDVRTADGVARAWSWRGGDGARPAVLVYPDAFGVRPTMHAIAERIAGLGYVVLLPDVFYRAGDYPPFDKASVWTDPPERERLMNLVRSITPERLRGDAGAYLDAIAARADVREDRVGVVGYCMGGRLSFLTAALHPDRVRAAASFHGAGLVSDAPESPHRLADRVRASVYLGVADQDRGCTPEHQGALATALAAGGVPYCMELYRGKKHGFAVPDHPGAYDPDAAERHWRRLESFFRETLG
jgi:carboxymethylenebutenolidase